MLRADGRLCVVPYEPALPVNTGWDLGMGDDTCIVFHQRHGKENRVIDFYQNHGFGLGHYVNVMRERGYVYGTHYLPHDANVRNLGKEEKARTRLMILQELAPSEDWELVPKIEHESDGTEAVRLFLPTVWIDAERCNDLVRALDSYRREGDDKLGAFKAKALHDWASHPEAAVRSLACGFREKAEQSSAWRRRRRPGGRAA